MKKYALTCPGAMNGTLFLARGYSRFLQTLRPAGRRFLNQAHKVESSEQNKVLQSLLAFDSKELEINLDYFGAALDSLESIYLQNTQNSFEYALMMLSIIAIAVRAFVESYAEVLSSNLNKKLDYVLPWEVVSQAASLALKAFFTLVKPAVEANFNPWDSVRSWTEVEFESGRESLALQSCLPSILIYISDERSEQLKQPLRNSSEEDLLEVIEGLFFWNPIKPHHVEGNLAIPVRYLERSANDTKDLPKAKSVNSSSRDTYYDSLSHIPELGKNVFCVSFEVPGGRLRRIESSNPPYNLEVPPCSFCSYEPTDPLEYMCVSTECSSQISLT